MAADPSNLFAGLDVQLDRLAVAAGRVNSAAGAAERGLGSLATGVEAALSRMGAQFARFVQLANPAAVIRFNQALADTQAVVGQILTPVFQKFTGAVRALGDALISLDPVTKSVLAGLSAGGALAGVLGAVASALALAVGTFGGLNTVVVTLVSSVAGLLTTTGEWKTISGALASVLRTVGQVVQSVAAPLARVVAALAPTFAALAEILGALGKIVAAVVAPLAGLVEVGLRPLTFVLNTLAAVVTPFARVLGAVAQVLGAFAEGGVRVLGALADAVAKVLGLGDLAEWIDDFASAVEELVKKIEAFAAEVRRFFGLAPLFDPGKKSSVGAAARPASFSSVESFVERAQLSAYGAGTKTIDEKQLGALDRIADKLEELPRRIAEELAKWAGDKLAGGGTAAPGEPRPSPGERVVNRLPVTAVPGGPDVGDVRRMWRSMFG